MKKRSGAADSKALRERVRELETRLDQAHSTIDRLTENEIRQNELLGLMTDAVFVQQNGRIVFANPAAASLHGFETPEQLIGAEVNTLIHPDDRGRISSRQRKVIGGAAVPPAERRGLRRDGTIFECETRGSRIAWKDAPAVLVVLRDITGRRNAERELTEKSALLGTTLEIMGHGYCLFDAEARLISFNRKYLEIHQFPPGAIRPGMHYRDVLLVMARMGVFGEGDIEEHASSRVRSALAGEERTHENSLQDGSTYLYQRRPMPNGGFVSTFTDITERKRAEQAVRDSEARYRGLIEESILPIQISTVDRSFLYVNRAYIDLLGYDSVDDFFARRANVIAPHDRPRIIAMAEARKRGEAVPDVYEYDAVRKDGTLVPLQSFSRKILWEGKPAYQRTLIDLTERRQAERSLQDSEARYRDLIEESLIGMQIATRARGRMFANRACAELFGYDSPEELLALPRLGLVAEHDRARLAEYRDAMLAGEPYPEIYEFEGIRKDRSVVPIQVFMRPIVWWGESAIQRSFIDLTERKQAEEQLRQAQKMEAVGQLTGGVAHDFNNLLTVVQGNLTMIAGLTTDAEIRRMAETALRGAKRGAELTHRLLAFSRKQTLAPQTIQVDELVAEMSELMCRTLGETVEIAAVTSKNLWRCEVDPGQLENAILNLALNARDAMPQGGRLTIQTRNAGLADPAAAARVGVSPGDYVLISVADTGAGMSAEQRERAFEPFFTTKEVGLGSGLGLSMVHGFITQSGGFVHIESAFGQGTTVKMYLPRADEIRETPPQDACADNPISRGELILVLEDDPDVRAFTVVLLNSLGYRTVEAGDGPEAIEILSNTQGIDLLFADVVLPGAMSGVDVAREAARLVPGIGVLFTSGYAQDVLARHGGSREKLRLIKKPFDVDDLVTELRAVLNEPRPSSA